MAKVTILFAALLIALGVVGYVGTPAPNSTEEAKAADTGDAKGTEAEAKPSSKRSVTALIPAFAGGLLLICGVIALNEGLRMHAMHGAVLVGLLGFLAAAGRGSMGLVKLMSGNGEVNSRSLLFVWLMAILCGVFVGLCVNSFIQARKRRTQEEAAA